MKMSGTGKNNFITFLEIGYKDDVVSSPKTAKAGIGDMSFARLNDESNARDLD